MNYTELSYAMARQLTLAYSTSFGTASRLFDASIRPHIYAIYGMVRVADEIVDTYDGDDKSRILSDFEQEIQGARQSGYSTNPIIHAFVTTAERYAINVELVAPFFESMHMDLTPQTYDQAAYEHYIYGSAEVVGLMCLKVFVAGDTASYDKLAPGARALGSAYQKVNFLRDMKSDYEERGRTYFPSVDYKLFDDTQRDGIVSDIQKDFNAAAVALDRLPAGSRRAVAVSYAYYQNLLSRLATTPASIIKRERIRVPDTQKFSLFVRGALKGKS